MKFFAVIPLDQHISEEQAPRSLITYPDTKEKTESNAQFWYNSAGDKSKRYQIYSNHLSQERFEQLKGSGTFCFNDKIKELLEENERSIGNNLN